MNDFMKKYAKEIDKAAEGSEDLKKALEKAKDESGELDLGKLDKKELAAVQKGMGKV
jgi:hypothetical protein